MSSTLEVCRLCESSPVGPYPRFVGEALVCQSCAASVANAYWMAHSGEWLTWDNVPRARPSKEVITRSLSKQVFERDAYRCVTCGGHVDLTCDHVVAESKGGPTTFENLQTMCRSCNSRKGTK